MSNSMSFGLLSQFVVTVYLINDLHIVNPEIFARILFSQIALNNIFATLKIRYWGMI